VASRTQVTNLGSEYRELQKVAGRRINALVNQGKMKRPSACPCFHCGGPACMYHHFRGYEGKNQLLVLPLCGPCHVRLRPPRNNRGKPRTWVAGQKETIGVSLEVPKDLYFWLKENKQKSVSLRRSIVCYLRNKMSQASKCQAQS
jgi:hypothetical protein